MIGLPRWRNQGRLIELTGQEGHHGDFLGLQAVARIGQFFFRSLLQRLQQASVQIAVEDRRMDVALAADGRRIAEHLGDRLDGLQDVLLGFRLGVEDLELLQGQGCEVGRRPGAKILCGHRLAGDLLQVVVDLVRSDAMRLSIFIDIAGDRLETFCSSPMVVFGCPSMVLFAIALQCRCKGSVRCVSKF